MSNSKFLSDVGWKEIAAKNTVKDNGLLKKLADTKRVGDDKPEDVLQLLDEALKLAGQLRKDKKTAPAAGKYPDEMTAAAETAVRDLAKAKAEADKTAKAKAEAEKKAKAEAANKAGDEDDEEPESPELLTTKLKPLLRLVAKDETMHTLVAKSGKQVVVMLSRKPIPPARRKMLAEQLGGGSTKYYPGHCSLEQGATTFVLKAEVAGMSKLIKAALLEQTGLRVNKVKCRGDDGDDHDGDEAPTAEGTVEHAEAGAPSRAPEQAAEASDAPATPRQIEALEDRRREFKRARGLGLVEGLRRARPGESQGRRAHGLRGRSRTVPEDCCGLQGDRLDPRQPRRRVARHAGSIRVDVVAQSERLHELAANAGEILERYQRYVAGNGVMRAIDEKEFADVTVHAPVVKALADLRKSLV